MTNIYEFYSKPLDCNVTVSYKDHRLVEFKAEDPLFDVELYQDHKYHLFSSEKSFIKAVKEHDIKVTILKREVSFEMFWDKYNYKASGKIEASRAWERLTKKEREEAYDHISVYESQLKSKPVSKLHGSSYLNAKRWIK